MLQNCVGLSRDHCSFVGRFRPGTSDLFDRLALSSCYWLKIWPLRSATSSLLAVPIGHSPPLLSAPFGRNGAERFKGGGEEGGGEEGRGEEGGGGGEEEGYVASNAEGREGHQRRGPQEDHGCDTRNHQEAPDVPRASEGSVHENLDFEK